MANVRVEATSAVTGLLLSASPTIELPEGGELTVGRHGDLPMGVDPEDAGLSRRAVTVRVRDGGWAITVPNANGAMLCPWGQPARWCERDQEVSTRWPLLAIRVLGRLTDVHHWVLLENEEFVIPVRSPAPSSHTSFAAPPAPLTEPQQEAVAVVFDQYLAWPPVAGPSPVPLQAAAHRLGVSHAAVYQRLEAARVRANALGAEPQIGVSDPGFVFALVRAGYVRPGTSSTDRVETR